MSAATFSQDRSVSRRRLCWAFSATTHALVIIAAMTLAFDPRPPRREEPSKREEAFRWDVAIVQSQPSPQAPALAPSPVTPTPPEVQPVTQPAPKRPQLVKAEPVVQTMPSREATKPEPVQPLEARQSVKMLQPIQETQPVQERQPAQRTQPIQEAQPQATIRQTVSEQAAPVPHSYEDAVSHSSPVSQAVSQSDALVEAGAAVQPVVAETATPIVRDSAAVPVSQVAERGSVEESHPVVETAQKMEQAVVSRNAPPVQQRPVRPVQHLPVRARPSSKPDYGWLAQALWTGVDRYKRYPDEAKMNRWEGKVTLRLTIEQREGFVHLVELAVEESSGYALLDHDALDIAHKTFPLPVQHALAQSRMQLRLPISYQME